MMAFSFKDFIAGWGAGMCGLLVGHPFDTVKVKQQVQVGSSVLNIVKTTMKQDGVTGFYRGLLFPLLLAGIQNSVFFGIHANTLRVLQEKQGANIHRRTCAEDSDANKYWHLNVYISGCTAAFFHGFIACPVELIKIKIQAKKNPEETCHRVFECCMKIYKSAGILGFYRGLVATLMRDIPICGLYFLFYEHILSTLGPQDKVKYHYSVFTQLVAGGISGCATWGCVTPLDVVKSRLQADNIANPKYKGVIDCFVKSYKEEGLRAFGKGFWMLSLRGFPVNAATFVGYEWFLQLYEIIARKSSFSRKV